MPRAAVADADLDLAVTDDDHDTLQSQLGDLADSDLQATHDYLHSCAQQGKLLPKFGKDDMERLHGAVEAEQASRAQAHGQQPPAKTPLAWPTGGALQTSLPDDKAARMPGHLSAIRDRRATNLKSNDPNVGGGVDRDKLKPSDFVFPEDAPDGGFPVVEPKDVGDAVSSWGRYKGKRTFAEFKSRLTALAKRKGAPFEARLPEAWTEDHADQQTVEALVLDRFFHLDGGLVLNDGGTKSWMQVARTGEFESSRYGKFAITKANLSQMFNNFKTRVPQAPTRLPVDYDHLSMDPQKPGDGKAAGWFVDLELRDGGDTLWGLVEWTPDAAKAISAREYQFVSPSFARNYTDKQGDKIGTTLLAAAITNHPFLEGMAPLSLSTTRLGGATAVLELAAMTTRNVHTDRPTAEEKQTMAAKTFKMKDVDGKDVEVPESEMENCSYVKSLMAKLPKEGEKVVKASEVVGSEELVSLRRKTAEQTDEITQLRADRVADRKERKVEQAQAKFDALVARGFATPAEKDRALKLAKRDVETWNGRDEFKFDLFEDWCSDHKTKVVELGKVRGSSDGEDGNGQDPVEHLMGLVQAEQAKDTTGKTSFEKAWDIVCKKDPEAYENYRKAVAVRV